VAVELPPVIALGRLTMSVWFNCEKCGEALAAAEKKTGILIACPKCKAANKIPGIAMQQQATKKQIEQMETMLKRHRQSLWMFLVLLMFLIVTATITASFSRDESAGIALIGIGILIGSLVILGQILKTCEYLGTSKYIQIFLFLFLSGIWFLMCFILYVKLKNRISYLKQAGIRVDES
jgi:phage FluMu protein Com